MKRLKGMIILSIFLLSICAGSYSVTASYETVDEEINFNAIDDTFADEEKTINFNSDGTNNLNFNGLYPGDIILLGTDGTFFDYLIPGEFSHTVIFSGFVEEGELIWDRDNHEWMPVGTPYVVHSTKSDNAGNGLGYSRWSVAVNEHAESALALRVDGLSVSQLQGAVDWIKSFAGDGTNPEAYKYDWGWTTKQIYGTSSVSGINGWYCSELAWAAYKYLYGIDLDPDGDSWSWTTAYGVSPSDLYEDSDSFVVDIDSWDPSDCYYVKINLVGIYYEDDYDPWPSGAGEMYVKWFLGDGYGGSGYVIEDFHGIEKRDGPGYVYWEVTMAYVMIPKGHPLKIRVEAWEEDGWLNGDDQYPVFNWWEDSMLDYVDDGWYWWNYWDAGDCRYCIEFSISNSPIGTSPNGI